MGNCSCEVKLGPGAASPRAEWDLGRGNQDAKSLRLPYQGAHKMRAGAVRRERYMKTVRGGEEVEGLLGQLGRGWCIQAGVPNDIRIIE